RKRNNMRFILAFGIERRQLDRRSLPPQSPQRFIQRDPREPGGQARIAAEIAKIGEGTEIGLLNNILRLAVVPGDGPGDAVETPVVPLHDDAKGAGIALASQLHKLGISERVQVADPSGILPLHCHVLSWPTALDAPQEKRFPDPAAPRRSIADKN